MGMLMSFAAESDQSGAHIVDAKHPAAGWHGRGCRAPTRLFAKPIAKPESKIHLTKWEGDAAGLVA